VDRQEAHRERERAQQIITAGLRKIANSSPLFEAAHGRGAHQRLALRRRWFPYSKRSQLGQLIEATISQLLLRDSAVLAVQLRFFPAIFATEAEVAAAMDRMAAAARHYTPLTVYWQAVTNVVIFTLKQYLRKFRKE
jgi:acetylornithine/succinyldiaminopimelate/putrescine aminotransferase